MFQGKMKAVTFSYDDGVTQDIRFIELLNRYGLKGTFNLNSELLGKEGMLVRNGQTVTHNKVLPHDVRSIYEGHEVAAHTLTHPNLTKIEAASEIVRQVEQDRINLSELCGYEVFGMAYPCGGTNNDDRVAKIIREQTGIRYARALETNGSFDLQENLYRFRGTVYHHEEWDRLFEIGEQFLHAEAQEPMILYIWGHTYEFDIFPERWQKIEEFFQMIAGQKDIFYGTNREVLLENKT
ncbi:MAG: polysaccharide deacetylase family protein [Clostridia bacterium]|nr:polysaccharide deacetylase family protein [Clostridia bacterium]